MVELQPPAMVVSREETGRHHATQLGTSRSVGLYRTALLRSGDRPETPLSTPWNEPFHGAPSPTLGRRLVVIRASFARHLGFVIARRSRTLFDRAIFLLRRRFFGGDGFRLGGRGPHPDILNRRRWSLRFNAARGWVQPKVRHTARLGGRRVRRTRGRCGGRPRLGRRARAAFTAHRILVARRSRARGRGRHKHRVARHRRARGCRSRAHLDGLCRHLVDRRPCRRRGPLGSV